MPFGRLVDNCNRNCAFYLDILIKVRYNVRCWQNGTDMQKAGRRCYMKRRKGDEKVVYQSLVMVTQFSLNMLVPICLMSVLGVWLDRRFGTSYLTILCFTVGAIAGGQNIYRTVKRMFGENGSGEERESSDENNNRSVEEDQ